MDYIPIINATMELADCRDKWTFDEGQRCWCLEDVLYAGKARVPKFQRLSVFVPEPYLNADGTINESGTMNGYTARTVPVVFENNSAGYAQMPHCWIGGPRSYMEQYLERGLVYVTCGCRGCDSHDADGVAAGKAPWTLVDLKTAIRFLRHNAAVLPGDWQKVISVGWSAGGAMSSLLSVTGDHPDYDAYLIENGAFMDESDRMFAAQIYCPITDLEHADMAYEWMFNRDKQSENSPAGPAEVMTPFKKALSSELYKRYIAYFNALGLSDPRTGEKLVLSEDGRGGSGYDYLMDCLERSATTYLRRLDAGEEAVNWTIPDYLTGNYTYEGPAPMPPRPKKGPGGPGPHAPGMGGHDMHHIGPGERVPEMDRPRMTMGDMMSRPPKGETYRAFEPPKATYPGKDKTAWLSWDGEKAHITSLDDYVLNHRRRMKPCTAFDKLEMDSGENQEFGSEQADNLHFDLELASALEALKDRFPKEYERWISGFVGIVEDQALAERVRLINPMRYIEDAKSGKADHYRIRVGASDADTALIVSMVLAVRLQNASCGTVDYALVWDQPHCEADYPGEVCDWIEAICKSTKEE